MLSELKQIISRTFGWLPPQIRSGLLVVLVSCAVLLPGLGSSGLWDPWEMRSAEVARTMMEPARVMVVEVPVVVLGEGGKPTSVQTPLSQALGEAWGEDVVVWGAQRVVPERSLYSKKTTLVSTLKHFRSALDTRVYHGIVLDGDAFVKDLDDEEGLEKLARELDTIITSHDGAMVALGTGQDDLEAFRGAVKQAWMKIQLGAVAHWFPDDVPTDEEALSKLADSLSSESSALDNLHVFGGHEDVDGLISAMDGIESLPSSRAQFIRDGAVRSIPVLGPWMVSASYSLFGVSEWSSRFPSALLGIIGVLLVFVFGRMFFGERVGLLAAAVLLTMPMHFASARVVGSEMASSVFLLAGFGLLAALITERLSLKWVGALVLVTVGLFFSKGLYGVLLLSLIVGAYFFVTFDRRRALLVPMIALFAVFALLLTLVFLPGEWSYFSHFRFMRRLFTHGPLALHRTFDHFIRQLGFGLFPWSVLLPFAFGSLALSFMGRKEDTEKQDSWNNSQRLGLLLFLYFVIPLVVMMVTLKDFSHLVYPAVPAIALGVAVFLDRMMKEERLGAVAAFAVGFMMLILIREMKDTAEPMVEFLSLDPSWLHAERVPSQFKSLVKGAPVFPDDLAASKMYLGAAAMGLLVMVIHFGRLLTTSLKVARFFQKSIPFAVGMLVATTALALRLILGLKGPLNDALLLPASAPLSLADRLFARQLFQRPEHVLLMSLVGFLLLVTVFSCTGWGRGLWAKSGGRLLAKWPALFEKGKQALHFMPTVLLGWALFSAVALGVLFFGKVDRPAGFGWGTTFSDPAVWILVVASALSLFARLFDTKIQTLPEDSLMGRGGKWLGQSWRTTLVFVVALALYVLVRLTKEVWIAPWWLWALLVPVVVLSAMVLARQLIGRPVPLIWVATAGVAILLPSILVPLVYKWRVVESVVFGSGVDDTLRYLFVGSRTTLALYALVLGLAVNMIWASRTKWLSVFRSGRSCAEGLFFGVILLAAGIGFWFGSMVGSSARLAGMGMALLGLAFCALFAGMIWREQWQRLCTFFQGLIPATIASGILLLSLALRVHGLRNANTPLAGMLNDPLVLASLFGLGLLGINTIRRYADLEGVLVFFERGRVAAVLFLVFAGVSSMAFVHQLVPDLSLHVSQKHLIDTYENTSEERYLRGPLLKYGKLFENGDEYNFYTRDIPAISDKGKALDVLVHRKDVMVKLTGASSGGGNQPLIVAGWDKRNDPNGDGIRDWKTDQGVASEVNAGVLKDYQKDWGVDQWAGHLLVDSAGTTFAIIGNTATELVLAKDAGAAEQIERGRLVDKDKSWTSNQWAGFQAINPMGKAFAITSNTSDTLVFQGNFGSIARPNSPVNYRIEARPRFGGPTSYTSRYGIDHPDAPAHEATAMERDRTFVMLPQDGLSGLNHEFRKRANGRHIPILDKRSSRILLASSRLVEGEKNQNWVAQHTLTKKSFAKRKGVRPGRVQFDDKIVYRGFQMEKDILKAGEKMRMTLYFEVLKDLKVNHKIFMHIERTGNRIHGDHFVLNQAKDGKQDKCEGCYQTKHWRKGDIIVDVYEREIPTGTPAGPQDVWMGIFNSSNDKRLKVGEFDKKRIRHDGSNRVKIGTFQVR